MLALMVSFTVLGLVLRRQRVAPRKRRTVAAARSHWRNMRPRFRFDHLAMPPVRVLAPPAAILALLACVLAWGAAPALAAKKRPFVYVVVVDGLDGDSVETGEAPFISSLLAGEGGRGTYFPESSSVIPAETNPNHTAMMTGAFPGQSGIAANAFAIYAPLENEDTCARTGPLDFTAMPTPTSGESPTCPRAETIFESVRRQKGRRHPTTAAIMGKPKLGRIFDVSYRGRRAADYLWAPCDDPPDDDEYCDDVPTNPVTGYAANDTIVMDEVIRTVEEGVPSRGRTRRPRFTFVNLPQVDSAGHALGRGGVYDAIVGQADAEIERLVGTLKDEGIWGRSVLMVVSDHSMDSTPTKVNATGILEDAGIPSDSFTVVQNGSVDFVYLANRRGPKRARNELLAQMRAALLAEPDIAEAYYRRRNPLDGGMRFTVDGARPGWTAGPRTGDIMVTAEPGAAFSDPGELDNPLPGNHGAPQTADNFMAVLGGWPRIRTVTVEDKGRRSRVRNAGVASTAMRLLGMRPPADNSGRPLAAAFRRGALRRR